MVYFNGEQLVERETDRDEAGYLNNQHRHLVTPGRTRQRDPVEAADRMGDDQQCGGGHRVIRKRIGGE